jgi:3-hydroxy acid dehydrogenase / malonic semialdehyde reductase
VRSLSLTGRTVFITGASSGIGAACAHHFAATGARLILTARRRAVLDEVASSIQKLSPCSLLLRELDVSRKDDVQRCIRNLPDDFKNIDILLNNAGLARGLDPLQVGNIEEWEEVMATNVLGLLYVTREILPLMVERNSGHIINIGSISSHRTYRGGTVYCATKHAVAALSRGLKKDVEGTRVRVSSIDPGIVQTNFSMTRFHGDTQRADKVYSGMEPLTAEDVADIVLFAATRPERVNVSEVIVLATDQPSTL